MDTGKGFTLVELMVVTAIIAILASVAIPAYINYINRTKQGQAASALMTARLEQEEWYADNQAYAKTIECLPSFGNSCSLATASTYGGYTFSLPVALGNTYQVLASRAINANIDKLTISPNSNVPTIQTPNAIGFSIFQWIFGQ